MKRVTKLSYVLGLGLLGAISVGNAAVTIYNQTGYPLDVTIISTKKTTNIKEYLLSLLFSVVVEEPVRIEVGENYSSNRPNVTLIRMKAWLYQKEQIVHFDGEKFWCEIKKDLGVVCREPSLMDRAKDKFATWS